MRPSQAKTGGGGYLNGVVAKLTGYEFVASPDTMINNGKRAGQTWSPISLITSFRVDGAEADLTSRFLVGDNDKVDITISDDGQTLTFGEGVNLFADNEVIRFVQSVLDAGFPEDRLDDDPSTLNLAPLVNGRYGLEQVVNAEKTKLQGKQIGKNGTAYDRKDLRVATVVELPSAGKAVKGAKKSTAPKAVDVSELATETLIEVLGESDGSLAFSKLKMKVFGKFGTAHPNRDQRDAVLKFLGDSVNVAGLGGIEFDGKKQIISLA